MKLAPVVFAFFKKYKISYYQNHDEALFPCLLCGSRVTMMIYNTSWDCSGCGASGNLQSLHELVQHSDENTICVQRKKIYHPRHERNQINYRLRSLMTRTKDKRNAKELESIYKKLNILLAYLMPEDGGTG